MTKSIEVLKTLVWADVDIEDGGAYNEIRLEAEDDCLYFRICSYDEEEQHSIFDSLIGKTVKLTIQVVE